MTDLRKLIIDGMEIEVDPRLEPGQPLRQVAQPSTRRLVGDISAGRKAECSVVVRHHRSTAGHFLNASTQSEIRLASGTSIRSAHQPECPVRCQSFQ